MNELVRKLMYDIEQGKSRRQIADKTGVSDTTIRKVLAGKQVKIAVYEKLADNYLHLPREEVYRMAGILPSMRNKDGSLTREWMLAKLWELVSRLPEADQALVLSEAIRLNEQYRRQSGENDEQSA